MRENSDVAKYCTIIGKVFRKVSVFLTPQPLSLLLDFAPIIIGRLGYRVYVCFGVSLF